MTLGPALNLQPFLAACTALRAIRIAPDMPARPFYDAAQKFSHSLGEEYLPGLSAEVRHKVAEIVDCLSPDLISVPIASAFFSGLKELQIYPSRAELRDSEALWKLVSGHIKASPGAIPAAAIVEGGIEVHKKSVRGTLIGLYDDHDDAPGDTLVFGTLGPDGKFHISRPSRMARKSLGDPEALPPIPVATIEEPLTVEEPSQRPAPIPAPPTSEHAAGVHWNTFMAAIKSSKGLDDKAPLILGPEETAYLDACEARFKEAQEAEASGAEKHSVWNFQQDFLLACRSRGDLLGVMLRAAQRGIITFPMVVQAKFDTLQREDIPLVDGKGFLLKLSESPLTQGNVVVTLPAKTDYILGKEIGEGGTSKIYRALDTSFGRSVAIKVVEKDAQNWDYFYENFLRECNNQGTFTSERFVHAYGTGWTTQGKPFIAMELCDGSLSDLLYQMKRDPNSYDEKRALDIAKQLVMAVADMHQKDYVHRDIKPDNFFVKGLQMKLGDTGLSKSISELEPADGRIFGTPGYMPPEVSRGEATGSKGADAFALGVVLYELFTGTFCFDGPSQIQHITNSIALNPPPPSRVAPKRIIPEIIDRIIMKCLEKDPEKRYQDALGILHDLVTVRAQQLVEEANESRRKSHHTGAEIRINLDIWRDRIKEALRELRRVYDEFPLPSILQERISLNKELFDWADSAGETEELIAIRDSILALDRELQGLSPNDASAAPFTEAAKAVNQPVLYDLKHDRPVEQRSKPRYDMMTYEERGGYLEVAKIFDPRYQLKKEPISARRGPIFGLRFTSSDHMPVYLPLPPRPGTQGRPHPVRIPTYRLSDFHAELREKLVIIPAAGAPPMRPPTGRITQPINEVRVTDNDIGVLPMPTNRDYYDFLLWVYSQDPSSLLNSLPQGWRLTDSGDIITMHGGSIDWTKPVTMIDRDQNEAYLAYLSQKYGRQFRNCSLFEWKLLARGADGRVWTWGSALPEKGTTVMRFGGYDNELEPVDMAHLRDISPYSVPKIDDKENISVRAARSITHVVGNTFKRLHLTDEEKRRIYEGSIFKSEILQQYGSNSWQTFAQFLRDNDVLAGVAYDQEPTQTPDGLKSRPRNFRGPISFFPVTELRANDASGWVETVTGKKPSNRPPRDL